MLASDGYPVSYEKGYPIEGLENFKDKDGYYVFHAGTAFKAVSYTHLDVYKRQDLTDLRYLYKFGEYITENEIGMANFLNTLPEEKIQAMARTFRCV